MVFTASNTPLGLFQALNNMRLSFGVWSENLGSLMKVWCEKRIFPAAAFMAAFIIAAFIIMAFILGSFVPLLFAWRIRGKHAFLKNSPCHAAPLSWGREI